MAFPHDYDNRGDIKTLRRAAWADPGGKYVAYAGGSVYHTIGYGEEDFNWDNAEGWAHRPTYHGTNEINQFAVGMGGAGSGGSSVNFASKTGLTSLMRLDSSGNNTTGTSGRVIRIQNGGGNPGDEAYTSGFFASQTNSLTWANCVTPNDGQWCITWYGRKSTSAGNSGTVRQTIFALGCKYDGTNKLHMNFTSATNGGSASSGTLSSPKTGGTYYYSQRTLTTSWTKYTMHFKFNGDTNVNYIALRFDNDDGVSGGTTTVYFDRVTLHPANIFLRGSGVVGTTGTNKSLNAASFGNYA